jgi:hypothetical protein
MLNRSSIFALAAMAAVAVAAPTSASAMRGGFGSSGGVRSFSSVGISHTAGIAHVGTTGIGTTGGYSPGRDSFTRRFTSQSGVIKCLLCGNRPHRRALSIPDAVTRPEVVRTFLRQLLGGRLITTTTRGGSNFITRIGASVSTTPPW